VSPLRDTSNGVHEKLLRRRHSSVWEEYLQKPTQTHVDRLLAVAEARDFPCMLGTTYCMQ